MTRIAPDAIIAVVGPTATGKSDYALELAHTYDGEVINADAMQLYIGMDIGTAKLPAESRRGIAHHQLDVLQVWQEASVAAYQRKARADIADIQRRGKRPILVGGSGLYIRAALEHFNFPPTDPTVRHRLQQRAERLGPGVLHDELAAKDPRAAANIERANTRRIVRALEVIEITGEPFSATLPDPTYVMPTVVFGLDLAPEHLDHVIERRAQRMFDQGLIEETEHLITQGLLEGKTAQKAVGYRQAIQVIEGSYTREQAMEQVTLATRQLARRQRRWFARDKRITWIGRS